MLKQNGWTLVRIRGSHHVITHPNYPKTVTVPHPKKVKINSQMTTYFLAKIGNLI